MKGRKEHCEIVQHSILEIKKSTKRKSAFLKVGISNELATKLLQQKTSFTECEDGFPLIMSLRVHWDENTTPVVEKGIEKIAFEASLSIFNQ